MSSIIPFLDESETLFSQEDVIRARTMVIIIKSLIVEEFLDDFQKISNIAKKFPKYFRLWKISTH